MPQRYTKILNSQKQNDINIEKKIIFFDNIKFAIIICAVCCFFVILQQI